jgi:ABC-type glycerol-3-phosphate transport system substrate-binding protein
VEPYLGNIGEGAKNLMQYNGVYYAVPYEIKSKLWFYRSDMFADAGIDVSQVKTQAEFLEAGAKLQEKYPSSYLWNIGPATDQYNLGMIVSGNGARYSTEEPCEIVVGSDPGVKQAFEAMYELRHNPAINDEINDWTPEWQAAFADGTLAGTLQASWTPTFIMEYAPELAGKWAVTTWPVIGGADGGSEAAGSIYVIPEASPNKEAAAKFLTGLFMDPKGAQPYTEAREGGFLPAVTAVLESDFMKNNAYFGPSLSEAFAASLQNYNVFPFDPAAGTETQVVVDQLVAYLNGSDPDPTSFLQTAQDELAAQVGCPYNV